MNPFDFISVSRIVFGRGQFNRIGELATEFGRSAFVVTNADRAGKQGLQDRLAGLLASKNIRSTLFWLSGEPTAADVDRGVAEARAAGCDVVLGLGGGSAIDAAKAVAGLLSNGGAALDYMEVVGKGLKLSRPSIPFIAIPTTAGTGAEVTRNAVIGCPEKKFKASIRSEHLLPRVALVDAELTLALRPEIIARTGMDALTQLIESYTSKNAQPLTDALALQGIKFAVRALPRAFIDSSGTDLDAREDMSMAALLSGITLANAGLGAVHGFAAPLGALFPMPHGTVCAALLPHVMRANIAALHHETQVQPLLERYAEVGRLLTGRLEAGATDAAQAGVQAASNLARQFQIPGLSQFGLVEKDFPAVIALARKSSSMRYNPVVLPDHALAEILRAAL